MNHTEARENMKQRIIDSINESCLTVTAVRQVLYEIDQMLDQAEEAQYQAAVKEKEKGREDGEGDKDYEHTDDTSEADKI